MVFCSLFFVSKDKAVIVVSLNVVHSASILNDDVVCARRTWMGFNIPRDSIVMFSSEWMSKYGVSRPWALFYFLVKALTIFAMGFADWS